MKDLPLPLLAFIIFAVVYVVIHILVAAFLPKLPFGERFKYNISFGTAEPEWPTDVLDHDKEKVKVDMAYTQSLAIIIGVIVVFLKVGSS